MHFPQLIQDLAVILAVAALVTFIFRRIKQPVVLGYIVAGIIVGPYTPPFFKVGDMESIRVWAELGVIFLMFTLGLEFSFRRLARVGMSAGGTAVIQIAVMLVAGLVTANFIGWNRMDGVFLGCMIAVSSTTIIIKALEELRLKTTKFAELVFGILIVEDLAAILMLVALTNIAMTSEIGGIELLLAAGKLGIVVGVWFLVGMFLVPRSVKSVSRYGNDEMLTIMATGLCLVLVAVAAFFHYSVALGAFIMGSILAETTEAKRIEHLVQPLKDVFGAVFFVSVGMMLDPNALVENWGAIAVISLVIIFGKLISVTVGAVVTGQTLKNSVQTGFSMAQIGEFSFIIASLGLSYQVISPKVYPVIVAASLVTTFTTPYLIQMSGGFANFLEGKLPAKARLTLDQYVTWVQRRSVGNESTQLFYKAALKWALNGIVVVTLFTLGIERLAPFVQKYVENETHASAISWVLAFVLSAPSILAMASAFRQPTESQVGRKSIPRGGALLFSRVLTIGLVGLMSIAYFPALVTLLTTLVVCIVVLIFFRRQVDSYYRWIEGQFQSGFQNDGEEHGSTGRVFDRLAPWDAHLVELKVPARSTIAGKKLIDLKLRETYGLNVVVIMRDGETIVAPAATEVLFPSDRILCFATDAEIERFRLDIEASAAPAPDGEVIEAYDIGRLTVQAESDLAGISIRDSGIRERFGCIVVGLERGAQRIRSPASDMKLDADDVLWIVGDRADLRRLEPVCAGRAASAPAPVPL